MFPVEHFFATKRSHPSAAPFRFSGECVFGEAMDASFYITDGAHAEYAGAVRWGFVLPRFLKAELFGMLTV